MYQLIHQAPIILLNFCISLAFAQNKIPDNLIPNPGFESFTILPSDWYFTGNDFSNAVTYWTSPTTASPDLYGPNVHIPHLWMNEGFGRIGPSEGHAYAGITVYGCNKGKLHCREYLQVQLNEALVPGQHYGFSCMLAHLQKSVSVKNIGLWFSDEEISHPDQTPLLQKPVLSVNKFLPSDGKWYRWTGHFQANESASFLLIGNFYNDKDSQIKMPSRSDLRFGYYYVDDVRLFKIPPILAVPEETSPFATYIPRPGEIITLGRIYFDHDRADFMPRALVQLGHLLDFMKQYPLMQIEIIGHTDMVGSTDYNMLLSQRRALAVLTWLTQEGISSNRLSSRGLGNTQPIGPNNTHQGRSQNRRVEIKVIAI